MNLTFALNRASRAVLPLLAIAASSVCASPHKSSPPQHSEILASVDYSRDIRPILAINCFTCHGQDPLTRQGGLRLDLRDTAIASRPSGRAIDPGKPEKSAIIARINSSSTDLIMPPVASQHRLNVEQKRLLTLWVKQGAPYADHWAFAPLTRPAQPKIAGAPSLWVRNPIDSFVLRGLQKAGLIPAPEADRYTLIRRLSLDLTGLPPAQSDVTAFMGDGSKQAYEHAVDRLLNSPRYGEHWARMWLDLMRYADTQGYEKDNPRTIWRYRDWVIDAFNADMPFDRFTIEQLAGDLLANPTDSQLLATACHRNTMTNTEGGVDPEEFRVAAIKDRVDTTGQVWMGLTIGCAKCHSHKYDPVTNQEYYRFYALFNQTADANYGDETPTAQMPTEDQRKKLAEVQGRVKSLRESFDRDIPDLDAQQAAWEKQLAGSRTWRIAAPIEAKAESGATIRARTDGALLVSGTHKDKDVYTLTCAIPPGGITAMRLEALKDPSLPNGGPGRDAADQNVVTSEITIESIAPNSAAGSKLALTNARADFEQGGWPISAAIDGNPDTGWAFSPQNAQSHVAIFDLKSPLPSVDANLQVRVTIRQNYARLQHGCFRISFSSSDPKLLQPTSDDLSEIAARAAEKRSDAERLRLKEAFRQTHAPTDAIWKQVAAAEADQKGLEASVPRIPIMKELTTDKQRVTRIHRRGNFMDPGDTVTPAVPAAFGALPAGSPPNRLGAAQWLVSKSNPLTPRVAVNRIWARIFGVGIVETEEDFGTQGAPPSNPDLLNYLAASFRDDMGWSYKKLCKTIVMSSTYRQASVATPLKKKTDPRNLLLSRGPRFRMTAEMIRDQALAVSGLLSSKMHGPSMMPPQPSGIWRTVYSGMKWETSKGEDRYRRGLYTFWRRSSPYPAMTTFDAGSGEFCVVRRIRTNTPLQALVTLNDPAYIEAAGALGKLMFAASPIDMQQRIITGFRRTLVRSPYPAETARLVALYNQSLAGFKAKPEAAKNLLAAANLSASEDRGAELAACITVANVLLNLDETVSKP